MVDSGLTPRLRARIRRDFPEQYDDVAKILESAESGNQDRERVLSAIVLTANGDMRWLREAVDLSHLDWRDTLVAGGLANEGWPERMDDELGRAEDDA